MAATITDSVATAMGILAVIVSARFSPQVGIGSAFPDLIASDLLDTHDYAALELAFFDGRGRAQSLMLEFSPSAGIP